MPLEVPQICQVDMEILRTTNASAPAPPPQSARTPTHRLACQPGEATCTRDASQLMRGRSSPRALFVSSGLKLNPYGAEYLSPIPVITDSQRKKVTEKELRCTCLVELSRSWIINRIFIKARQSDDASMTTALLAWTRLGATSGGLTPSTMNNERPTRLKGDNL